MTCYKIYEILNANHVLHTVIGQGICLKKLFHKTKVKEYVRRLLLVLGLVLLVIYGCPVYRICNIPCPCCGVTRAWLAFLQGQIELAFRYHALFPVIPVLILLYMFQERFSARWKQYINVIFLIMATVLFIYAIMRWTGFVDMP